MYNDYAISERLFSWQSQRTTPEGVRDRCGSEKVRYDLNCDVPLPKNYGSLGSKYIISITDVQKCS